MTRYEYREKCIEAMQKAGTSYGLYIDWFAAFDALHGIAFVCGPEVTDEMDAAGAESIEKIGDAPTLVAGIFLAMSAAGDLTNPTEGKP